MVGQSVPCFFATFFSCFLRCCACPVAEDAKENCNLPPLPTTIIIIPDEDHLATEVDKATFLDPSSKRNQKRVAFLGSMPNRTKIVPKDFWDDCLVPARPR